MAEKEQEQDIKDIQDKIILHLIKNIQNIFLI